MKIIRFIIIFLIISLVPSVCSCTIPTTSQPTTQTPNEEETTAESTTPQTTLPTETITPAQTLPTDDFALHFERGNAHLEKNEWYEAISEFTEAIELNPEYAEAYANRALARFLQLEYNLASGNEYNFVITDCEKAIEMNLLIEININLARAYVYRGDYYFDHCDYDEAITDYAKAIALNPSIKCRTPADVYIHQAENCLLMGEYNNAIAYVTKALEINTENIGYYHNLLAEAHAGQGFDYLESWEPDKAIKDFTEAIKLNPNECTYYYQRGETYYQLADYYNDAGQFSDETNSYNQAIADYTKAIELGMESDGLFLRRGNCYAAIIDYASAIADYTKVIEFGTEIIDFGYFNRACAYETIGNDNEAIADYTKVIEISDNDFLVEQSKESVEKLQTVTSTTTNIQITKIFYDGLVYRTESDEYVEIKNLGSKSVNLAGWKLVDIDEGYPTFTFPSYILEPGQSVRVYTNEIHPEYGGFSFRYGKAVWNNSSPDTAVLYNAQGQEVSRKSY